MENENVNVTPKKNVPRNLFLHLLAMVTLYWSTISFVTLAWQCINIFFPDSLYFFSNGSGYDSSLSLIRFNVSAIIIVFPVFIIVSAVLNKIYAREYVVRDSKIRKWLIYLTLFIAALVIIGDLVSVLNTFLGGEITTRFILKALSVLAVAAVVFGYYLDDIRHDAATKLAKYFAWGSGALVLAIIVLSFIIVGSPNSTRLAKFDQQRISDLQNIQQQVINYWRMNGVMPTSLGDFNNLLSGFVTPIDPQTNASYEYHLTSPENLSFELCANFNKPSEKIVSVVTPPISPGFETGGNWGHGVGRICFERTIDEQLYPPLPTTK